MRIPYLRSGARVKVIQGVLKGEYATIEENPDTQSFIQGSKDYGIEVWIRYEKDGVRVGRAILNPQWIDIELIKIVG